ncbi:MAG: YqgE/AlgH family protein [Myxococcales bacterium]|nr:YqgE/AlgH family protein [Myxococcales bacterium]
MLWKLAVLFAWIFAAPVAAEAEELATGKLLIATEQLSGSAFDESVILLLDHSSGGAVGLIVNRPLGAPLARWLPDVEALRERQDEAWLGGPVAPTGLLLLIRSAEPLEDAIPLTPGVQWSRSLTTLRALLSGAASPPFRAYAGYAGWGPRQLEGELARGAWIVAPADQASVFPSEPASLWRRLLRRFQPVRVEIQSRS